MTATPSGPSQNRKQDWRIPFNKPSLVGDELRYIQEAVNLQHLAGDGTFTRRCHEVIERKFGARKVLLTSSCSAALEMTAWLADIGPGDEVIMPSFTFVSTANAFVLRGAVPVFVDIHPDTGNLDEELVEDAITSRTKAIVPVHYAGVGCAMEALGELARERGLVVIEDAAHAFNARWNGRFLGTFGELATYSFHETKNSICGEGGALVINDSRLVERAEILRQKGTDRAKFYRGQVDKYTWVDVGSSYLPSDLTAAFLLAQLEKVDEVTARRRAIYDRYHQSFADLAERGLLTRPLVPASSWHNAHMYFVLLESTEQRQTMIKHLAARGVLAVYHYIPLHSSPHGRRVARTGSTMAVTDDFSGRLLRMPLFYSLTDAEQDEVVAAVRSFFGAA
jgi:dTDP-4-amino-4,6-dideoxygalactose transaminase